MVFIDVVHPFRVRLETLLWGDGPVFITQQCPAFLPPTCVAKFDCFFGGGTMDFGDMPAEGSEVVQLGVAFAPLTVVDVEGGRRRRARAGRHREERRGVCSLLHRSERGIFVFRARRATATFITRVLHIALP